MMRNSGNVVGVALAGAILLAAIAPAVGDLGLDALRGDRPGVDRTPLIAAFMTGFGRAYTVSAVLAACGAAISLSRGEAAAVEAPPRSAVAKEVAD